MPRVNKRARREDDSVELACEWGPCQETFSEMQEFCRHVEEHQTSAVCLNTETNDCGRKKENTSSSLSTYCHYIQVAYSDS